MCVHDTNDIEDVELERCECACAQMPRPSHASEAGANGRAHVFRTEHSLDRR